MKLLFCFLYLVSVSIYACPDLSGHYSECRPTTGHSTGSRDMVVSQINENDVTTYNASAINSQTNERESAIYKADGLIKLDENTDPNTGKKTIISSIISCLDNKLSIYYSFQTDGVNTGFSKVLVYKTGHHLIIESHSKDLDQEGSDREICE